MHKHIQKLYDISRKSKRRIVGLMSGTSVDGLDIALCNFIGSGMETTVVVENFVTIPFGIEMKEAVKSVFSKEMVSEETVCLLNPWIALEHAKLVNLCLKDWGIKNEEVDLIASHGQTIYHAPKTLHKKLKYENATLQIGDGDHLAYSTGIITISDFRQKHIAAGGEGAPLAVYGDFLIFSKPGANRVMLNMGGIANFTYLTGDMDVNKVFSTDTGPGNTLMDAYMQQQTTGYFFDEDAKLAKQGRVHDGLLLALKAHPFFDQEFPKTTGPELFNLQYLEEAKLSAGIMDLSVQDTMATLNRFSAETIAEAILKATRSSSDYFIYASGGGMHNPLLMRHIKELLPGIIIETTASLGVHPDAKEAVLFAILANECICGGNTTIGNIKAGIPSVTLGKISFPD